MFYNLIYLGKSVIDGVGGEGLGFFPIRQAKKAMYADK